MAVGIDGDDAAGAAEIEESPHLLLVDQIAICSAGADAQRMFDAPTHDVAAFSDMARLPIWSTTLLKTKAKPSDMPATGDRKNF